jgi:hypothetical protein
MSSVGEEIYFKRVSLPTLCPYYNPLELLVTKVLKYHCTREQCGSDNSTFKPQATVTAFVTCFYLYYVSFKRKFTEYLSTKE